MYGSPYVGHVTYVVVVIGVDGRMVAPVIVIGVIVPGVVPCAATTGVTVNDADATLPKNAAIDMVGVTVNVADCDTINV